MKFAEIIKSNSWLSIEIVFLKLYPEEEKNIIEYKNIFNSLQILEPKDTDISIDVKHIIDDYDNYGHVDVSGHYNDPHKSTDVCTNSLALEFTPWEKWLGMDIDKKSLEEFTELELISHCLHEMTYFSFDQKDIQEEFEKISGMADEIKNMTEEEKNKKLIPFEDVIKKKTKKKK